VRAFAAFLVVGVVTSCVLALTATLGDSAPSPRPTASKAPAGRTVQASALLARQPYLGVACGVPNSIRCDRVGLAVWLRRPAVTVRAAIAGRRFELTDQHVNAPLRMYVGFLRGAGLADGALQVPFGAGGRWFGEGGISARARVWVQARGRTATIVVRVPLRPGWG
jgi:hypothetical protein